MQLFKAYRTLVLGSILGCASYPTTTHTGISVPGEYQVLRTAMGADCPGQSPPLRDRMQVDGGGRWYRVVDSGGTRAAQLQGDRLSWQDASGAGWVRLGRWGFSGGQQWAHDGCTARYSLQGKRLR